MHHLGLELIDLQSGSAKVRLVVDERHLNFNGTCHGGVIFSLADSAFGLASNTHGLIAAGVDAHITYAAAANIGDVLIAIAKEETRSRRLASYRVIVSTESDKIIATFTGTVYITGKSHSAS